MVLLECGHDGRIIWRRDDGKVVGVQGTQCGCRVCGKISEGREWSPTVYLIELDKEEK